MTSKAALRKLIDKIEGEYQKCWRVLSRLKEGRGLGLSDAEVKELLEFQLTLATALFRLDEKYRALSQEQAALIAKKRSLSPEWFRRRMKTLADYQKVIKGVITLGRALGDAFAWMFYQDERQYLEKHFEHESLPHTPPGIGGKGELELIRNVRVLNNQLTIYHGTTTFLRIGDVSFVDLKTLKVTAIGELKTERVSDTQLKLSLFLLWPLKPESVWTAAPVPADGEAQAALPPKIQEQLKKQLKKMAASFDHSQKVHKLDVSHTVYTDELKRVVAGLKKTDLVCEQAGDGLLLMGVKNSRLKSLSSRLLVGSRADVEKRLPGIEKRLIQIMDASQAGTPTNMNSIIIGGIDLRTFPGATPIFWWPIQAEILRKIFFREVEIVTMYNPAHLMRKLIELGFTVETLNRRRNYMISRKIGRRVIEPYDMSYLLKMVQSCLIHEDVVISVLSDLVQMVEAGEVLSGTKVYLSLQQHF
jgi:hypothetical protein